MKFNDEAKKRLMKVANDYPARLVDNFSAVIELAKRIADADSVMLKIDPDSVEEAVKNVLGVV